MTEKGSEQGVCVTWSLFAAVDCMHLGSRSHLVVSDRGSVDCCPSCPGRSRRCAAVDIGTEVILFKLAALARELLTRDGGAEKVSVHTVLQ